MKFGLDWAMKTVTMAAASISGLAALLGGCAHRDADQAETKKVAVLWPTSKLPFRVALLNVASGTIEQTTFDTPVYNAALSPSQTRIAVVVLRGARLSLELLNAEGRAQKVLLVVPAARLASGLAWSPDESKLAFFTFDAAQTSYPNPVSSVIDIGSGRLQTVGAGIYPRWLDSANIFFVDAKKTYHLNIQTMERTVGRGLGGFATYDFDQTSERLLVAMSTGSPNRLLVKTLAGDTEREVPFKTAEHDEVIGVIADGSMIIVGLASLQSLGLPQKPRVETIDRLTGKLISSVAGCMLPGPGADWVLIFNHALIRSAHSNAGKKG